MAAWRQPLLLQPFVQLLLVHVRLILAQQTQYINPIDFLATSCLGLGDATMPSAFCSLDPGNWIIRSPYPPALLSKNMTTITGAVSVPQFAGAVDITNYSTQLFLPANASEALFHVPPNTTVTLSSLRIFGAFLRVPGQPELPAPSAISIGMGARLRLLNLQISTTCESVFAYQRFACSQRMPSPNFNIDYGTLTFLSFSSPSLDLVNVTVSCTPGGKSTPPPCISVVASSGPDLLLTVEGLQRPPLNAQVPIFVYISRNFSLLTGANNAAPSASAAADAASPPPSASPPLPPPPSSPSILLKQDWLNISGPQDAVMQLDLTGSESLIQLDTNARVVLQDLGLMGLPLGPSSSYPLALLRVPLWTFAFPRLMIGTISNRLTLRNLRLSVTPVELATLASDATAPATIPLQPSTDAATYGLRLCARDIEFFGESPRDVQLLEAPVDDRGSGTMAATAAGTAPTGPSLLIRAAKSLFNSIITFDNVTIEPTKPWTGQQLGGGGGGSGGGGGTGRESYYDGDWRREPLCQLLPLQPDDDSPQEPLEVQHKLLPLLESNLSPVLLSAGHSNRLCVLLQRDASLLTGPPTPGNPKTFSQSQSYIDGAAVLLGDPVRPRLLDTRRVAAAVNLQFEGASLTLRSLVLINLAAAGLHPLSTASTTTATNVAEKTDSYAMVGRRRLWMAPLTAPLPSPRSNGPVAPQSGCGRRRRRVQYEQQPPPLPPPPPPPPLPEPLSSPSQSIRAPAGTDPTAGLPAGLANFTSCLWLLDTPRNANIGPLSRGRLDSVVLVLPRAEVQLFAWLTTHNDTAAVTDPQVARQLRDMLDRSVVDGVTAGGAAAAAGGGGGGKLSVTFKILYWCGLTGRNVTLAAAWRWDGGASPSAAQTVLDDLMEPLRDLTLPVLYTADATAAPSPQSPTVACGVAVTIDAAAAAAAGGCPPAHNVSGAAPPAARETSPSGVTGSSALEPRVVIVAVVCSSIAGLLAALLTCVAVMICVRWRRRQCRKRRAAAAAASPAPQQRQQQIAVQKPLSKSRNGGLHGSAPPSSTCAPALAGAPYAAQSSTLATGEEKSVMAAAAAMAAAAKQQQQLLVGQIAVALHTRMIRMRDAVIEADGGSDGAAVGAVQVIVPSDLDQKFPWLAGTSLSDTGVGCLALEGPSTAAVQSLPVKAPAAATVVASPATSEIGMLTVTGELGRGAQGTVYRGRWKGIEVAVKSLLLHPATPAAVQRGTGGSRGAAASAAVPPWAGSAAPVDLAHHRALREAALSVAASQHPNVVATYHVDVSPLGDLEGEAGGGVASYSSPYWGACCWKVTLISQLCDGGSLRSALSSGLLADWSSSAAAVGRVGGGSEPAAAAAAAAEPMLPPDVAVTAVTVDSGAQGAAAGVSTADVTPTRAVGLGLSMDGTAAVAPPSPPSHQQHQQQQLQPQVLLLLALDVASGLAQLHSASIVHGDISSSNVLLTSLSGSGHGSGVVGGGSSNYCSSGGGAAAAAAAAAFLSAGTGVTQSISGDPCSLTSKNCTTGSAAAAVAPGGDGGGGGGGSVDCTLLKPEQIHTGDDWLSNSSDALALLVELPYQRVRRARYVKSAANDSVGMAAAVTAAPAAASTGVGRYGYVAKLCDFGLAEVMPPGQSYISTPCRRSGLYTAPEVALEGRIGPASDVYSWAVLCWEMAMGMPLPAALAAPSGASVRAWLAAADATLPASHCQHHSREIVDGAADDAGDDVPAASASALPPSLLTWPPHVPHALAVLVGECLTADPATRPTAKDVVQRLEHIITSM